MVVTLLSQPFSLLSTNQNQYPRLTPKLQSIQHAWFVNDAKRTRLYLTAIQQQQYWPKDTFTVEPTLHYLEGEIDELREAIHSGNKAEIKSEYGDIVFNTLKLGLVLGFKHPLKIVRYVMEKMTNRFAYIEDQSQTKPTPSRVLELWAKAKHYWP